MTIILTSLEIIFKLYNITCYELRAVIFKDILTSTWTEYQRVKNFTSVARRLDISSLASLPPHPQKYLSLHPAMFSYHHTFQKDFSQPYPPRFLLLYCQKIFGTPIKNMLADYCEKCYLNPKPPKYFVPVCCYPNFEKKISRPPLKFLSLHPKKMLPL